MRRAWHMQTLTWLMLLSALYPLTRAWFANRSTSLWQALSWGLAAWCGWLAGALISRYGPAQAAAPVHYLALALTCCMAVAVLGARRPIVGAWNFVVVGLLAVLLLPLIEGMERWSSSPIRVWFLAALLAVGMINYLPTRYGLASLLFGMGCTLTLVELKLPSGPLGSFARETGLGTILVAASTWLGLALAPRNRYQRSELNRVWLEFRDRFGLVWAQPVRDQFNRAAVNAGWPVQLDWAGLTSGAEETEEMTDTIRALLKRF